MKLSKHNLLSLRCAMTELGYQWRRDQHDSSRPWQKTDHWCIREVPGIDGRWLALHPVVVCDGDLITTDVACTVQVRSDQTLGRWELTESYVGSGQEIDPRAHALEDLPNVLRDWVKSFGTEEPRRSP
jgi:hypothetical protein